MKLIEQSWQWISCPTEVNKLIELAGRTCYKSENRITEDSADKFVGMLLGYGHESVLEHVSASVRFITNRGVTHELVRHRLASYSQESTRYVRYKEEMCFIKPVWWEEYSAPQQAHWLSALSQAEQAYKGALLQGDSPERARELLPHAIKTEVVMTANLREWRHVFKLRCSAKAHPQIVALMKSCLAGFYTAMPIIFAELWQEFGREQGEHVGG